MVFSLVFCPVQKGDIPIGEQGPFNVLFHQLGGQTLLFAFHHFKWILVIREDLARTTQEHESTHRYLNEGWSAETKSIMELVACIHIKIIIFTVII